MVGIGAFPVFKRTRRNIEPYSPLKPTKVGFFFIGLNSFSRAEDLQLSIMLHKLSLELGLRLGLKVWFKELQLEPKLLNCGLRI